MSELLCTLCGKEKQEHEVIEGMNGNVCKECISVIQELAVTEEIKGVAVDSGELNIQSLKKDLDTMVMGQEDAKRQLLIEMFKKYVTSKHTDELFTNPSTNNVLLVGDSGVGKTHIVRSLSKILDVPFLEIDITTYSQTGYKGNDVANMIEPLIIQEGGNVERIEQSIVFIDEIDKIASTSEREQDHHSTRKVQQALLKMIDGMPIQHDILQSEDRTKLPAVDTSKITFIAAGAFVGLSDIRKERLEPEKKTGFVGFNTNTSDEDKESELDDSKEYVGTDMIGFGLIPELVGRFPLIVELHPLERDDYKDILLKNPDSILKQASATFSAQGIDLEITDDDIDWIVDESIKNPLGVRGIAHVVTKGLNNMLYEALINGDSKVSLSDVTVAIPSTKEEEKAPIPLEAETDI